MYKCEDCGEVFDRPKYTRKCMGEFWGMPAYETWAVCPYCDSEEITKTEEEEEEE